MITIRTGNYEIEGSVDDIIALLTQISNGPTTTEKQPPTSTVEREIEQTTLDSYTPFKPPRVGLEIRSNEVLPTPQERGHGGAQRGMKKVDYETGRKVHSCSACGAPHRRMNPATGTCKVCAVEVKQ